MAGYDSEKTVTRDKDILMRIDNVTKHFGGVTALNNVSLDIERGKVLAFVGENGAGKSTLINIISGLYAADSGEISMNDKPIEWKSPAQALRHGVAVVHQELTLFTNLSVADNIFIGNPAVVKKLGRMDTARMEKETRELLTMFNVNVDPWTVVSELSLAQQQIVEVAKAIKWDPAMLILDEATSALDARQVDDLFEVVRQMTKAGAAVVFVSHRMQECMAIAQQAIVVKDGVRVGFFDSLNGVTENDLVNCMLGRTFAVSYPAKASGISEECVLEVVRMNNDMLKDVSVHLNSGEIIGLGGLRGHGQESLLRSLFGLERYTCESLTLKGRHVGPHSAKEAIKSGITYVPPDRKTEGLTLDLPAERNLMMAVYDKVSRAGIISGTKEKAAIRKLRTRLQIKQREWMQSVKNLSGGNQQKVVLGKWLETDFSMLLMDEPTRGIDVATKYEIYEFLRELAGQGVGIMIASTDALELIGLCDRVYVFFEGKVHAELGEDMNEENFTHAIMGL